MPRHISSLAPGAGLRITVMAVTGDRMFRPLSYIGALAVLILLAAAPGYFAHWLGGNYRHAPEDAGFMLSGSARELIQEAFSGFQSMPIADYNVHLLSLGTADNAGYVNPKSLSWWYPRRHMRLDLLLSAAGVRDGARGDDEYVARLIRLLRQFPIQPTIFLSAFDAYYAPVGRINRFRTLAYVPNDYLARIAARFSPVRAVVSISPFRPGAIKQLARWARAGVRMVYWHPSAQGINPADPALANFYAAMKKYHITLLVHVGGDGELDAGGEADWNNPLRLRSALEAGLNVVMLTSASLGKARDLDKPSRPLVPAYRLFLRLMNQPRYRGQLYGDISALFYADRPLAGLKRLLQRRDLQSRLVYGSDYPFSAINLNVRLKRFVGAGFLSAGHACALHEIYHYNPLLFNFVLARTLHLPATDVHFAPVVFTRRPALAGKTDGQTAAGKTTTAAR